MGVSGSPLWRDEMLCFDLQPERYLSPLARVFVAEERQRARWGSAGGGHPVRRSGTQAIRPLVDPTL